MSEYCEYMWCDPSRGRSSLARSIYDEGGRFDKRDKKLAIKTVRSILRQMPDVGKKWRSNLSYLCNLSLNHAILISLNQSIDLALKLQLS